FGSSVYRGGAGAVSLALILPGFAFLILAGIGGGRLPGAATIGIAPLISPAVLSIEGPIVIRLTRVGLGGEVKLLGPAVNVLGVITTILPLQLSHYLLFLPIVWVRMQGPAIFRLPALFAVMVGLLIPFCYFRVLIWVAFLLATRPPYAQR